MVWTRGWRHSINMHQHLVNFFFGGVVASLRHLLTSTVPGLAPFQRFSNSEILAVLSLAEIRPVGRPVP